MTKWLVATTIHKLTLIMKSKSDFFFFFLLNFIVKIIFKAEIDEKEIM